MSLITGPKRAFGVGELKQQNAVIKVYTVGELKNALTKIYSSKLGIGTIQIAGDIVISEPIKLRQTPVTDQYPIEIVFEGVGGAKIINGRPLTDNYLDQDNIIFDMGESLDYPNFNICKYTFKNININTVNALPFRAMCQWSHTFANYCGNVLIDNASTCNLVYIFDARNTSTFSSLCVDNVVQNINITTNDPTYALNINSPNSIIISSSFSNFNPTNFILAFPVVFHDQTQCRDNIFSNIVNGIDVVSVDGTIGSGTITGTGLGGSTYPTGSGWQVNNDTTRQLTQLPKEVVLVGTEQGAGSNDCTIQRTILFNTAPAAGATANIDVLLSGNSRFIIEWNFNIKINTLNNSYKIITYAETTSPASIISNSTIFAAEEYINSNLTGLIPTIVGIGNSIRLSPTDSANSIKVDGTCIITGYKLTP